MLTLPLQPCPLQTKGPWWKEYENQQLLVTAFLDWPWAVRGFGSGPSLGYTKAVRGSHMRSDSPPNRRQWNTAEDARLEQLITLHGVGQWTTISSLIPGRSNKQCRERWRNHLDPAICRSPWAADEDALVVKLQADQGNRWSEFSQRLPGRTAHAVRSRWHFHLKPKQARTPRLLQRRRVKVWSDCSPERQKDAGSRAIDVVCERVLADAALADAVIQSLVEEDDG